MFTNFDSMTVEELLNKQIEIKQKIAQAYSTGMSHMIIEQMQNMLDQIMIEIQTKSQQEQEHQRIQRAIEEGRDPDEDNILNIGDVE